MSKKILIVDDEPDIIEFLKYNLEKNRFTVESAINGDQCLKKLNNFHPDLIILDIMMPKMNGVQTCEKIREKFNSENLIIVFLSARNEDFTQIACYDAGGDDFISKPIQPKLLIKKIEVLLKRTNSISNNNTAVNGIKIDQEKYKVLLNDTSISLPKKQFELLNLLYSDKASCFLAFNESLNSLLLSKSVTKYFTCLR